MKTVLITGTSKGIGLGYYLYQDRQRVLLSGAHNGYVFP